MNNAGITLGSGEVTKINSSKYIDSRYMGEDSDVIMDQDFLNLLNEEDNP